MVAGIGLNVYFCEPTPAPKKNNNAPRVYTKAEVKSWTMAHYKATQRDKYCLLTLWELESSWSWTVRNSKGGAYGIPQALPASKMASAGKDWRTNPITQIKWGLRYINTRYSGHACYALRHEMNRGWY